MKGQATSSTTIMMIVIFLVFFGIYLFMANSMVRSNIQLNIDSLQALKLKSTYSLFNKSLGMTWYITTAQALFAAGDESAGCGYDDGRVPQGFWYVGLADHKRNFTGERIPQNAKYNPIGMSPQVCYPTDDYIAEYMQDKIFSGGYLDLKNPFTIDDITIEREDPTYEISFTDNSVRSVFAQRIVATIGTSGKIDSNTKNNNSLPTAFRSMAASARKFVETLLPLGDAFYATYNPALNYQPEGATQNVAAYEQRIASIVSGMATTANGNYPDITPLARVNVTTMAADDSLLQILPSKTGLVVYYNATVRYVEGSPSSVTQVQWPTDSRKITGCYGLRQEGDDNGKFHTGVDIGPATTGVPEPVKAVAGGKVTEISDCPTCSDYGDYVLVKHENEYSFYAHLSSVNVKVGDSVSAGTQLGMMGSTGNSKNVHVHFEIRKDGTTQTRADPCGYMDCSNQCWALPDSDRGKLYYEDTDVNKFEKRPVTLDIHASDFLPAINCISWSDFSSVPVVRFNYKGQNDLACCGGYMFSCNVDVPKMQSDQQLDIGEHTTDEIVIQQVCNGRLQGDVLSCTSSGFKVTGED